MGSGYKAFTAGEVLTASDVNNYLMEQSVMVFADSTARASTIGTANFEEGMVSYLEDSDTVEVYDGSAWGGIAPVSNQGLTLLNTTSFSGVATQSINDVFSATYDNYRVLVKLTAMSTTGDFQFRYRVSSSDNTTSNYNMLRQRSNAAAVNTNQDTSLSYLLLASFHSTTGVKNIAMDIMSPFLTENSQITFVGSTADNVNNQIGTYLTSGGFNTTTSFTGFTIFPASGTMTGSVSVYGYSK